MTRIIVESLYAGYLGIALGEFADLHTNDWEFYAILVPVVMLVGVSKVYNSSR